MIRSRIAFVSHPGTGWPTGNLSGRTTVQATVVTGRPQTRSLSAPRSDQISDDSIRVRSRFKPAVPGFQRVPDGLLSELAAGGPALSGPRLARPQTAARRHCQGHDPISDTSSRTLLIIR
eukprot:60003-Hanusia_phi.AAC.1